jgi:hypothetical protein
MLVVIAPLSVVEHPVLILVPPLSMSFVF